MQMAKVNGGIAFWGAVAIACGIISAVTGVIARVYTIASEKTNAPTEGISKEALKGMVKDLITNNTSGKVIMELDSIVDKKIYGVTYELTIPPPEPTKAQ